MLSFVLIVSSLIAIIGVAVLAYGYRSSFSSHDMTTRFFSWSMALLSISIFVRRATWDIIDPLVTQTVDHRPLNIVYNAVAIAAVYFGLRARLFLIPQNERHKWHWWNSWQHPSICKLRTDRPMAAHEETKDA